MIDRRPNRLKSLLGFVVLLGGTAAFMSTGGCQYGESGQYISTPDSPKTVMIVNTSTGETVWTCDVPVGERLDIAFKNNPKRAQEQGFDEMTYGLVGIDSRSAARKSTVKVPPPPTRKIVWILREIPEPHAAGS